jgi:glycosyltransferase involved in cell wall biosynthesis
MDKLHILYTIQNVGNIDFSHDIGDTVPVKQTLQGLQDAGHKVNCLKLENGIPKLFEDVMEYDNATVAPNGLTGKPLFKGIESGVRRLQGTLKIPYFAFFDTYRFQEACSRLMSDFDICHEHNGLFCGGSAWACSRLGFPYVLTFSADPIMELELVGRPLKGLHAWVAREEARFTYHTAWKIICVSDPAKQHLVDVWRVNPEKIYVMPNGVDVSLFGAQHDPSPVRRKYGLDDLPVVGFVGGFQSWHGIDLLVESFARIRNAVPNCKLLLVGDGPYRMNVEDKIEELGMSTDVIITGLVPQNQVPELLSAMDVAVIPYPKLPKELWFSPLKLYEYMAAGKAIVASGSGQITEVIRDEYNGVLVKPGDVNELADKILNLLDNADRRAWLGNNAHQQAIERHSWQGYTRKLVELYRSVLAKPHPLDDKKGALA